MNTEAHDIAGKAIVTAGAVHARNNGNQDVIDLTNAIRQVALAVQALAKVSK
jgi:hypothetical protein